MPIDGFELHPSNLSMRQVYNDFLTDYEKMCFVLGKLEDCIVEINKFEGDTNTSINSFKASIKASITSFESAVNAIMDSQNATIDDYIELYNQLKAFVDNYFDNLDIQAEINVKIDALVNDGTFDAIINHTLFDSLNIRKTSLINLVELGVKNDGSVDVAPLINSLISEYGASNVIYLPIGTYLLGSPLQLNIEQMKFICDGVLLINTDITSVLISKSFIQVNIKRIRGNTELTLNNYIGTALNLGSTYVAHCDVLISEIDHIKNGIYLTPNNGTGNQYNKFVFDSIDCYNCIYFKAGDIGTSWVNENTFIGGRLMGYNGVITEKGAQQIDGYNGNKFNNIGFESIVNPIKIRFAYTNVFNDFRMMESITGTYYIDVDDSHRNKFISTSIIKLSQVRDISVDGNEYFVDFMAESTAYVAKKMYTHNGNKFVEQLGEMSSQGSPSEYKKYNNGDITVNSDFPNRYFELGCDSGTVNLNLDSRYGDLGGNMNQFYFKVLFGNGTTSIVNVKKNGTLIKGNMLTGLYRFTFIDTYWICEQIKAI